MVLMEYKGSCRKPIPGTARDSCAVRIGSIAWKVENRCREKNSSRDTKGSDLLSLFVGRG